MSKVNYEKLKFKPLKKKKITSSYLLPKVKQNLKSNPQTYILIVDDDETLLKFFKIHLTLVFSKITVVSNAIEASKVIAEKSIDLVLSDIKMPQISGIELLQQIKNTDPFIPVYLISGIMLDNNTLQYIKDNADGFLRKPFSVDEIHNFIKYGLKKRKIFMELKQLLENKNQMLHYIKNIETVTKDLKSQNPNPNTKKIINILNKLKKLNLEQSQNL